jgi:penicillin-binding protein 1A
VRLFVKVLLACLGLLAMALILGFSWLFFYSGDLPDINAMAPFSPETEITISDPCFKGTVVAIPYDALGVKLRGALNVAEAAENGPTAYEQTSRAFSDVRDARIALSIQIARTMFCSPEKTMARELKELRTAIQLDRRFSRRQLFTIASNRYYFGSELVGVQAASQYFFHRDPTDLSYPDAALLAGMVRAPAYYSPAVHPEKALARRNEVLDLMASQHVIAAKEAEAAKSAPLDVTVR